MEKEKKENRVYLIVALIIAIITLIFLQLVITQTKKGFSTSKKNEEPCSVIVIEPTQTISMGRQDYS